MSARLMAEAFSSSLHIQPNFMLSLQHQYAIALIAIKRPLGNRGVGTQQSPLLTSKNSFDAAVIATIIGSLKECSDSGCNQVFPYSSIAYRLVSTT